MEEQYYSQLSVTKLSPCLEDSIGIYQEDETYAAAAPQQHANSPLTL
jgi:hypothetical protein